MHICPLGKELQRSSVPPRWPASADAANVNYAGHLVPSLALCRTKGRCSIDSEQRLTKVLWKWVAPAVGLIGLAVAAFAYFHTPREHSYELSLTGGELLSTRNGVARALQANLAHHRLKIDIRETPGSEEALDMVNDHALDLALVQGGLHFENRPNVRQAATLQVEPLHLVVKSELADLVAARLTALDGKTVNLGSFGSGTHSLAIEVLAFVGLYPRQGDRQEGYQALTLDRHQLYGEKDRSKMPDAVFVVSALPSDLTRFLVNERDYRVVPLPFGEAFALDSLSDIKETKQARTTTKWGVNKGRIRSATIPAFTYRVEPPVPAEPLPVLGTRLLLVAHKDVNAAAVRRLVEVVYSSEFANTARPSLDTKLLELAPEFPWHDGTRIYLDRNKPVVSGMVIESTQRGMAIFAAAASGLFVLWQWLKMRTKFLQDRGFNKYITAVSEIEAKVTQLEHDQLGGRPQLVEFQDELGRLKREALARFTEGDLAGHELLQGFLLQVNDVRDYVAQVMRQLDQTAQSAHNKEVRRTQV
jgi:TRAP-type uncharacterized transport system substrate-binding protein